MKLSELGIRFVALCLGAIFVYCAFLYEDEDARLQSRLEDWWVALDDRKHAALTRQAVFVREIARLAVRFLDRLLGYEILSLRAVSVSICFSVGGASLIDAFFILHGERGRFEWELVAISFVLCVLFLVAGSLPAIKAPLFWLPIVAAALFVAYNTALLILLYSVSRYEPFETLQGIQLLSLPLSVLSDFYVIVVTRRVLRRVMSVSSVWEGLEFFSLALMALAVVVVVPYRLSSLLSLHFLMLLALMNVWSALLLCGPVIVAVLMLIHRLVWPTVLRPLYAAQRFRLAQRKKLLAWMGVVFVTSAFGPSAPKIWHVCQPILRRIIE